MAIYDQSFRCYVVANRPPQLGVANWRQTNSATFQQAGLYPVEILHTQITEWAINRRVEFTILSPFTGRPPPCPKHPPA